MKLHKPIVDVIIENIRLIFEENNHIKYVIKTSLSENKKFGSRDRRFVADHTIEIVRMFRYFSFLANTDTDYRKIVQVYFSTLLEELPNWISAYIDIEEISARKDEAQKNRSIKESFPEWLDQLLLTELGQEKWETEIEFLNIKALPVLRINSLKTSPKKLKAEFAKNEVPFTEFEHSPNTIELKRRRDLSGLESFKNGWFEMQDHGSQLIAPFLSPTPGATVIDACAGAGGKSLHLAELMKNEGKLISLDVVPQKLKELDKRAERAGIKIIKTDIAKDSIIADLEESADFLLLDVPCSGIGVLRRNPDDKWKLTKERITELQQIQSSILNNYASMLKKGGVMVYATCSILPSENEDQVTTFLSENKGFNLEEDKTVYPSKGGDGFYIARISKEI